jgi:predicted secreted hydrolase
MWDCEMNKLLVLCAFILGGTPVAQAEPLRRAEPGYAWSFPRDHGRHSDFQTEWWYYTGQLFDAESDIFRAKPRYGFQLTFFRRASLIDGKAKDQFMAHAVVTDIEKGETFWNSRVGGGELGLSGAKQSLLNVWSGDWTVDTIGSEQFLRFNVTGDGETYVVRAMIQNPKPPWLQGQQGWSKKAECSGCASQYYSQPRLNVTAEMIKGESTQTLRGLAWMDHEFMTNSLSGAQVGWDWMGLMLKDGRSLMVYRLRREDGSVDLAAASVRSNEGERALGQGEFSMTPRTFWRSPASKAEYPISWRVEVPSEGIQVDLMARVADSELGEPTQTRYWEGPVASESEEVTGYLEMTGYSGRVKF